MATTASSPARGARASIPRQPDRRQGGIVVAVVTGDSSVNTVLAGARLAHERGEPLDLVMFTDADRPLARCMAAVDNALVTARTAFPRLEVRVHLGLTDGPGWERGLSGRVSQVVADPSVRSRWAARDDAFPVTVVEE
jgi:hypothetical protein